MSYAIFLDDEREMGDAYKGPRSLPWVVVRSYDEAVEVVHSRGFPLFVSFDHDLGDPEAGTGMDFAKFLVDQDQDHGTMPEKFAFYVHSQNPVGSENILRYLKSYLKFKKEASAPPPKPRFVRHSSVSFEEFVSEYLSQNIGARVVLNGQMVRVGKRVRVYLEKGTSCVKCGLTGTLVALERPAHLVRKKEHYHLNLYAVTERGEVMITNDHVFPKSRGGSNDMDNLQPMCEPCNVKKGHKVVPAS